MRCYFRQQLKRLFRSKLCIIVFGVTLILTSVFALFNGAIKGGVLNLFIFTNSYDYVQIVTMCFFIFFGINVAHSNNEYDTFLIGRNRLFAFCFRGENG